ncbi:MAG: TRAP transporter large permease subunit [Deltaproteobacteria bacterium]|nr:TRAP transporter large permease subunit [Deltaproteobacteria bacterium]MBW2310845.1 TRAP transporter large permease subunit [Deltaproteobacteria bacterium]
MSPEHLALVMFFGVLIMVIAGFPLYLALGGLGLLFGIIGGWAPMVFDQFISRIYGLMASEVLPAVPLFVFMGSILTKSGAAERLYNALYLALGGLRGGLALVTIILCTIFAATAGIIGATETAVGLMALPAMLKRNYNIPLACGSICAGGTLGILIPPSVMLLLYGPTAGLSVAKLFIGAIGPGLLLSGLYLAYVYVLCLVKPNYGPPMPKEDRNVPLIRIIYELIIYMIPPLFLIFAVLGTILLGIASPTEAASVGAFGAVLVAIAYKNFNLSVLYDAAIQTLRITTMVMFVAAGAMMFSGVFMALGGAKYIGAVIVSLPLGKWGSLFAMLAVVVVLGMFIDWIGILFIVIPIFTPIALELGFNPLWFALVICTNLQMSFLTPPFAYSMFYLKGIAPDEVTMGQIYKGVFPFIGLQIIALVLVLIFPPLTLYLPSLM